MHRRASCARTSRLPGCGAKTGPLAGEDARLQGPDSAAAAEITARIAALTRLHNPGLADRTPLRVGGRCPLVVTFRRLDGEPAPMVLVRAQEVAGEHQQLCEVFARSHGLAPAEARLLQALVDDLTLAEYCARDGLKLWTERSRLQSVFKRTGVRRQTSLIIAVLSGVKGAATPTAFSLRGAAAGAAECAGRLAALRPAAPLYPQGAARAPLPSFTGLKAFEAFVRLGSMTAAALELRTFPSNISRHIRKLEDTTGLTLFSGRKSGVRPTPEGLTLAAAAAAAFDLIHVAAPEATPTPREPSSFVKAKSGAKIATARPSP